MAEVEVIKAVDGPILRKRDYEGVSGKLFSVDLGK